jgi:thiol-disulfide isomerase/thioredoxin
VRVLRGSAHTVYHSDAALPTSNEPRADGRPTLVWFSGTWCHFCERMEPFAWETASGFGDQLVFLEKSVDHDRSAASRFGVRGTPTFVLLDASGREQARFFYQADRASFASTIEAALARLGVG